jgi:hypothetical protein
MRQLVIALLAACLLAVPNPARAARVEPSEAAIKVAEGLRARNLGVDRAGNLWAWDVGRQKVEFFSPSGASAGSVGIRDASVVDADLDWGVVALETYGKELVWARGDGTPVVRIPLASPASGLCWVGSSTVAIAPESADHRVEIWNLKDRVQVKTLGQEEVLHPTFGATRLRAFVLRYDFQRDLLYALESFTGDLQVFTLDGKLAWSTRIENAVLPETANWLREVDKKAKEEHDIQTPRVWTFSLALGPDGGAWVVRTGDAVKKSPSMIRLAARGNDEVSLTGQSCSSRTFTLWGSWIVFSTDSASGREICKVARRLP